jgi:hypothetical protein
MWSGCGSATTLGIYSARRANTSVLDVGEEYAFAASGNRGSALPRRVP